MSMNIPKGISLGKKWFSLFFWLMILNLFSFGSSQSCDQVATLPKDISLLLPQYEKLKRIHLLNYFFLDDVKSGSSVEPKVSPNSLKISLSERSAFKVQVTPQHVGLKESKNTRIQTSSNTVSLPINNSSNTKNSHNYLADDSEVLGTNNFELNYIKFADKIFEEKNKLLKIRKEDDEIHHDEIESVVSKVISILLI